MKLLRYEIFECTETLNSAEILESKKSKYTDDISKIKDRIKSLKVDKKRMITRHDYEISDIKRRLADLRERKKRLLDYRKRGV